MKIRILLAGASGLVGSAALNELAGFDNAELHILRRRADGIVPLGVSDHLAAPEDWAGLVAQIKPDVVVSALGTTMKKAGSKEAFRAVDHDLVLAIASAARTAGARQFITVSSVGASSESANFYLRTKGEVENALRALDFERLDILQPGLLVGERPVDHRFGERLGILLSPLTDMLMIGGLARYRSIPAIKVSQAIVTLALGSGHGRFIHDNDAIRTLAG